ncbi:MAG: hypothetical protein RIG63_19250 [Coleofasciculus chthonoplastes F3-SA18-01]
MADDTLSVVEESQGDKVYPNKPKSKASSLNHQHLHPCDTDYGRDVPPERLYHGASLNLSCLTFKP